MVRAGFVVHKYLTVLATAHTISAPTGRTGLGHRRAIPERSRSMFARLVSLRTVVVAWILGLVLVLIPLASALADGGGTSYPR
jgi:hypothetical protein